MDIPGRCGRAATASDRLKLPKSKKVNGIVVAAYQWLLDSGGLFSLWSS